jgi:carbon-monoxide dehydrogenase medium subunit
MTTRLPRFDFEAPTHLERAVALLEEGGPEARALAGGTDLLVKMKIGELQPRLVVSLARLPDLARIDRGWVGSLATMAALGTNAQLRASPWAALADGAGSVGGPLIRHRATVGGNMINARPCADTASPLMVLGAVLHLASKHGSRAFEAAEFITGPGQTQIVPGEVLTHVELPEPDGPSGSAYIKVTRRAAMEITACGCAASITLGADGNTARARVALTSVAPVPLPIPAAARELEGDPLDDEAIARAAAAARDSSAPIDDHRASATFRRQVVEVITRRALEVARLRLDNPGRGS